MTSTSDGSGLLICASQPTVLDRRVQKWDLATLGGARLRPGSLVKASKVLIVRTVPAAVPR